MPASSLSSFPFWYFSTPDAVPSSAEIKRQNKRKKIVEEVVSTERTYVDSLRYLLSVHFGDEPGGRRALEVEGSPSRQDLVQEYLNPLTQLLRDNPELTIKGNAVGFSGIDVICKLHEDLLQQLQARVVDWDAMSSKVGDVLLNIVPPRLPGNAVVPFSHGHKRPGTLSQGVHGLRQQLRGHPQLPWPPAAEQKVGRLLSVPQGAHGRRSR